MKKSSFMAKTVRWADVDKALKQARVEPDVVERVFALQRAHELEKTFEDQRRAIRGLGPKKAKRTVFADGKNYDGGYDEEPSDGYFEMDGTYVAKQQKAATLLDGEETEEYEESECDCDTDEVCDLCEEQKLDYPDTESEEE